MVSKPLLDTRDHAHRAQLSLVNFRACPQAGVSLERRDDSVKPLGVTRAPGRVALIASYGPDFARRIDEVRVYVLSLCLVGAGEAGVVAEQAEAAHARARRVAAKHDTRVRIRPCLARGFAGAREHLQL